MTPSGASPRPYHPYHPPQRPAIRPSHPPTCCVLTSHPTQPFPPTGAQVAPAKAAPKAAPKAAAAGAAAVTGDATKPVRQIFLWSLTVSAAATTFECS